MLLYSMVIKIIIICDTSIRSTAVEIKVFVFFISTEIVFVNY